MLFEVLEVYEGPRSFAIHWTQLIASFLLHLHFPLSQLFQMLIDSLLELLIVQVTIIVIIETVQAFRI